MTPPPTNGPSGPATPADAAPALAADILRAAAYAKDQHRMQRRKYTNAPYILHPARVAARVMLLPDVTPEMVCAAWLHDVCEDCGIAKREIQMHFGTVVAKLVEELTNPPKDPLAPLNRAQRKAKDRERLAAASSAAKKIKLIDRIDNLGEMSRAGFDFIAMYVQESRELADAIYEPDNADLNGELLVACHNLLTGAHHGA